MQKFSSRRIGGPAGSSALRVCAVGFATVLATAAYAEIGHAAALLAQAPATAPVGATQAPAPAPANVPRHVPVNVQGVASLGLTLRVKEVVIGEDATILTVSASFSSRLTNDTELAMMDTFIEDPEGNRLMIKRPPGNRYLKIKDGETMEGQLVFLGSVPPSAEQIRLVINQGNLPDNPNGPGLTMTLPLKGQAKQ